MRNITAIIPALNPRQLRTHNDIAAIMSNRFGIHQIDTENELHRSLYFGLCDAYEAGVNRATDVIVGEDKQLVIETTTITALLTETTTTVVEG